MGEGREVGEGGVMEDRKAGGRCVSEVDGECIPVVMPASRVRKIDQGRECTTGNQIIS